MDKNKLAHAFEEIRAKKIKESGNYLELNILVPSERVEDEDETIHREPVSHIEGKNYGAAEITCMYMTLKELLDYFIENYPRECLEGELHSTITSSDII